MRESWRIIGWDDHVGEIKVEYKADKHEREDWIELSDPDLFEKYWIQCSDELIKSGVKWDENGIFHEAPTRWRSPLFMPRDVARVFLRVVDIRAERVQDISEDDMIAEGIKDGDDYLTKSPPDPFPEHHEEYKGWIGWNRACFAMFWNDINAKRGYSFQDNPYVWVIEFERIEKS